MKSEEKEFDINEMSISLDVDSSVIDRVVSGEITHITMEINEDNQSLILENINGNLVLGIDESPLRYHGCYLYNDGEFPYVIKDSLEFLMLNGGDKDCLARIIDVMVEPGMRFDYKGAGKPIEEEPDGESCVWEVTFEVVPVPKEPRYYLMRWNPAISSFKEDDYELCVASELHGMFRMNWSIADWEEARRGDLFFMMRTGDDKAGILFNGQFVSDPYPDDDWAGSNKRRMYVDLVCTCPAEPSEGPIISLEQLKKVMPDYEWEKGRSGVLLTDDMVTKLDEIAKGGKRIM